MENWTIQRVVAVLPTEGADYEAAYLLRISYGEEQAQVVVEFAAPASVPSSAYAQEVVGPYLQDDEPPQRLIVEPDGSVRVANGPLAAGHRVPRRTLGPREPQRGRRRGNR